VALRRAAEIPLSTAADCAELLTLLAATAPLGNRNALSDAHVAAHLAQTGLLGAVRNVRQNLEGLADVHLRSQLERRVGSLVREGEAALREIRAAIGTGE
jgi:formiminotetrahydrofolate cyclodeaminase